jgi:hypothetical protein
MELGLEWGNFGEFSEEILTELTFIAVETYVCFPWGSTHY